MLYQALFAPFKQKHILDGYNDMVGGILKRSWGKQRQEESWEERGRRLLDRRIILGGMWKRDKEKGRRWFLEHPNLSLMSGKKIVFFVFAHDGFPETLTHSSWPLRLPRGP